MTARFFDLTIEAFRSTWHGPARGLVIPFIGRPTTDGFVLEGRRDDVVLRWVFSRLTPDSFDWHADETEPGKTVPRVRQRFWARRQEWTAQAARHAGSAHDRVPVLLVEQNALAALALSDRAYVIDLGRTTLSGTGQELLADPRVQEAYLGEGVDV
jgi:hypothetical protein